MLYILCIMHQLIIPQMSADVLTLEIDCHLMKEYNFKVFMSHHIFTINL